MKSSIRCGILTMFFLMLWLCYAAFPSSSAKEPISLEVKTATEKVYEGKYVELVLSMKNLPNKVACFDLQIESDTKRFELKSIAPLGKITSNEINYNTVGSTIYTVYKDNDNGGSPIAGDSDILLLKFKVKDGAEKGMAVFSFQCDVIGSDIAENMGMASAQCNIQVTSPPSSNAMLTSLIPDTGKLTPKFSMNCFSYTLEVGENVDRISFKYKTSHPSANVHINRNTLNGKGRSTRIIIRVKAENSSVQNYIITVLRRKGSDINSEQIKSLSMEESDKTPNQKDDRISRTPLKTRMTSPYMLLDMVCLMLLMGLLFLILRRNFNR